MKKLSRALLVLLCACGIAATVVVAACADPYKDYAPSHLRANEFQVNGEEGCVSAFLGADAKTERVIVFCDYESFAAYDFPLDYSEEFFESSDLLVFMAVASSSDEMRFLDILTHDGKLYPCYSRKKIRPGSGIAEDLIFLPYCAELKKADDFKAGEVIYRYR